MIKPSFILVLASLLLLLTGASQTPAVSTLKFDNLEIDKESGSKSVFHFTITNTGEQAVDMRTVRIQTLFAVLDVTPNPGIEITPTESYRAVFNGLYRQYNYDIPANPLSLAPGQSVVVKALVNCGETLPQRTVGCYCIKVQQVGVVSASKINHFVAQGSTCDY